MVDRRIRRFSLCCLLSLPWYALACEQPLPLAQQTAIAHRIYLNECNGQRACLVDWNPGEDFPSLGIGHFIWYPRQIDPGYVESFPLLISYIEQQPNVLPEWLTQLQPFDAPWPDRNAFQKQRNSEPVQQLRDFLEQHQAVQIAFMQYRMQHSLEKILTQLPAKEQVVIERNILLLCQSQAGQYALIDYVNFKGEGLAPGERLQGEGWGLMQVLRQMPASHSPREAVEQFALSADQVLTRRARNAANSELETQWLGGWRKRIKTYTQFYVPE